jgi:hypothetical protein
VTNQNESKPPNSQQAQEAVKALVATDVTITQKPFLRCVTGSITNSSDYRFSYLVVRKVVVDLTDAVLDFGPGQIWNFEAGIVSDDAIATAQVKEIKGWL